MLAVSFFHFHGIVYAVLKMFRTDCSTVQGGSSSIRAFSAGKFYVCSDTAINWAKQQAGKASSAGK